jgi:parvulin-like peptidyl-prolyl isomerase
MLARTRSIDAQTRNDGGRLGWLQRGVAARDFEAAVFALPVGVTSAPIASPFGFHIVRVEAVDAPQAPPFDAIADRVRAALIDERLAQQRATLAQRYDVRVHQDVLDTLSRPSSR